MNLTEIFNRYCRSVIPIGWVYRTKLNGLPIPEDTVISGRINNKLIHVLPCATSFVLNINEDRTQLVTANHAFPDVENSMIDLCVIVPPFSRTPYELKSISQDDMKAYLGVLDYIRLKEQDICIFEIDTPEALYLLNPEPIPLESDFTVGDPVCTIGYPFIGYSGQKHFGRRDMHFVERLTSAHLSAIWLNGDTLTIEFDNYVGPGNSGGPLFNLRTGKVIGVVTWSRTESGQVTAFSHATCVIELNRARKTFHNIPDFGCSHCYDQKA